MSDSDPAKTHVPAAAAGAPKRPDAASATPPATQRTQATASPAQPSSSGVAQQPPAAVTKPVAQPAAGQGTTVAPVPPAAPTPLVPHALSHLKTAYQAVDFATRGIHLDATVDPGKVVEAARELDREGFSLDTITGVDWLAQAQMEVVYDFFHPLKPLRVAFRTRVPRDSARVPSIHQVFPGANWHERETHDFFGIEFEGHPDLSPFLLPEDATYHPLRKDFTS